MRIIISIFLVSMVTLNGVMAALPVVDIADRNQVFIDGRYIQDAQGVKLRVCKPKKTDEICIKGRTGGYSQIMEPDGVFRGFTYLTKDGVHWRRAPGELPAPDDILGVRFGGETVFFDPKASAELRYKKFDGMRNQITGSSDGIAWSPVISGMFSPAACYPNGMDSQNVCFFDSSID